MAVMQVALSLTLVIGALLFVATLRNLQAADVGFRADGVAVSAFGFRLQGYDAGRIAAFGDRLLADLQRAAPRDVIAFADGVPMRGGGVGHTAFAPGSDPKAAPDSSTLRVSPSLFEAIGARVVAGRTFTDAETRTPDSATGVMVTESLARALYGVPDATGRSITFGRVIDGPEHTVPIIGVVADIRWNSPDAGPSALIFRPARQFGASINQHLFIRSADGEAAGLRRIQEAAARIDPSLAVTTSAPLSLLVGERLVDQRVLARVLTVLAAIGFLLAAVGIHGLVSQTVVERTREFGVRMAIGATRGQVVALVLRSAVVIIAIGAPVGIALAYGGSRLLASRLYGVTPGEPVVYIAGVLALLGVVITASLAPARIASRANPVDVLRSE